jgi:hypothetical protein
LLGVGNGVVAGAFTSSELDVSAIFGGTVELGPVDGEGAPDDVGTDGDVAAAAGVRADTGAATADVAFPNRTAATVTKPGSTELV